MRFSNTYFFLNGLSFIKKNDLCLLVVFDCVQFVVWQFTVCERKKNCFIGNPFALISARNVYRMGICYNAASGNTCNFDPVTKPSDCPANVIPTIVVTTVTEPPATPATQETPMTMTLTAGRVELAASIAALAAVVGALNAAQ